MCKMCKGIITILTQYDIKILQENDYVKSSRVITKSWLNISQIEHVGQGFMDL